MQVSGRGRVDRPTKNKQAKAREAFILAMIDVLIEDFAKRWRAPKCSVNDKV